MSTTPPASPPPPGESPMDTGNEPYYQCIGICITDPDSGYCTGCGRPPEPLADSTTANDDRSTPDTSGTAR